jgi:TolB-like protein
MKEKDFVPHGGDTFLDWIRNFIAVIVAHVAAWLVPAEMVSALQAQLTGFENALALAKTGNHGKVDIVNKNAAKEILMHMVRDVTKRFLAWSPAVSDAERELLGITVRGTVRTDIPAPQIRLYSIFSKKRIEARSNIMKKCRKTFVRCFSVLVLMGAVCATAVGDPGDTEAANQREQAAQSEASSSFEGDGGSGVSIAILRPTGENLPDTETWLLPLIQSSLTSDFQKYSAMTVIDRQNLDTILKEQEISASYDSEEDYLRMGALINARYILTGSLTKGSGSNYLLALAVVDAESGKRIASYSPTGCTAADLENLSAVKKASEDLFAQLGINLTAWGKTALQGVTTANANAQTALAKGITAQQSGTVVEALLYYYQATASDPTVQEAASRASTLITTITSGSVGVDARNDIIRRNEWLKILRETAAYFKEHQPFEIIYDPEVKWGTIDYDKETVNFSFYLGLWPVYESFIVLNDLAQGLKNTGRSEAWKFTKWPFSGDNVPVDAVVFPTSTTGYSVTVTLTNVEGKIIGTATQRIDAPSFSLATSGRPLPAPAPNARMVSFQNVNVNDIADPLTVSITSVNEVNAQAIAERRYISISTENIASIIAGIASNGTVSWANNEYQFVWASSSNGIGTVGYLGKSLTPVIPAKILRWPVGFTWYRDSKGTFQSKNLTSVTIPNNVTSIGQNTFYDNKLTSVIIPNSVTSIGQYAFGSNQLTSVTIPNNVTSIGQNAFRSNPLTSVIIGNSVTSIGQEAFYDNKLTSVTIGNSVISIGLNAFRGSQLTSVVIPNSVITIGQESFRDNRLTSVVIGNSVTSIGYAALYANRLTSLTIPDSVIAIGQYAFGSNQLTTVTIPNSVTSIGGQAFYENQLVSVTIPDSVTSIGGQAFYSNPLTSVAIGANVLMENNSMPNNFGNFYYSNDKKAGTYTYSGNTWSFKAR